MDDEWIACPTCEGTGQTPGGPDCLTCAGDGVVPAWLVDPQVVGEAAARSWGWTR